jgi:hypothetical protein
MTEGKSFKRRVRGRMSKTGESYTTARSQVAQKRDRNQAARTRLAAASADRVSDAVIERETGKTWDEWLSILDESGARRKKHPEIARFLREELGVPNWWAQSVTVGYERARGMRLKYEHADGFAITASRTIAVPVDALFDAFVDDARRRKWLPGGPCRCEPPSHDARRGSTGRTVRHGWLSASPTRAHPNRWSRWHTNGWRMQTRLKR